MLHRFRNRHAVCRVVALQVATALLIAAGIACAQAPPDAAAAALQARRAELTPQLRSSPFNQPLVLRTQQAAGRVDGDVWADVAHPLAEVEAALGSAPGLCELMFLHLNVRGCTPEAGAAQTALLLLVGPKRTGAFDREYRMRYVVRTELADAARLRVTLSAADGPLWTHDHRIVFEAIPIEGGSFVHIGYSYAFGLGAQMAMGAYLATGGRAKIGFSVERVESDGTPSYVRGERAALERNVMRYYLALLALLDPGAGTHEQQLQARLRDWFARTERYAAQLHEYDLDEYLHEKNEQLAKGRLGR